MYYKPCYNPQLCISNLYYVDMEWQGIHEIAEMLKCSALIKTVAGLKMTFEDEHPFFLAYC